MQEDVVMQLKEIDPILAEPEVETLNILEAIYRILPKIKQYIQWTNTENINSLSASHFNSVIDALKSNKAHKKQE